MKLSEIKRDTAAIEKGVWVGEKHGTPIPNMGDLCLKVRGDSNVDWRRLQNRLTLALPASRRNNGLSVEDSDRIIGECLKRACVLDWEGIEGPDGQAVAFSDDQLALFVEHPDYFDLRNAMLYAAALVGKQRADQVAEDAKN